MIRHMPVAVSGVGQVVIGLLAAAFALGLAASVFASHRRRAPRVSVYGAVREAMGRPSPDVPGVWSALRVRIQEAPGDGRLWDRIAKDIDPTEYRPRLAPDIELRDFKLRWGNDYTMAANPRDLLHFRLFPDEARLIRRMDGTRTVKELVVEALSESGDLEVESVAELVRQLQFGGFLATPFVNAEAAVQGALDRTDGRGRRGREFVKTQTVEWYGADGLVRFLYDHGLKWFFNRWVALLALVVSASGVAAFVALVRSHRFDLSGQSLAIGFLLLLVLNYFLTFVHELGHALVLTKNGRRIRSAGFQLYFGSPAFFVDCSDGLMMPRGQRILSAACGPFGETIVAGLAAIIAWSFPGLVVSSTLYKFAVLNYLVLFMNLVPFLELDGYWILSDAIQVPDLRPRSLSFLRHDFLHKFRSRAGWTKQEAGLALYGILGVAFTIFSFYTAYFFWKEVFGGLLVRLWDGGTVTRLLLVLLMVLILGPLVRGLVKLVRSIGRRLRALWRRIRFRLERSWRVEAAELISSLPLLEDLPEDAMADLAGRVHLRTYSRGQPVFRQGDRAEAFFVVRRGQFQAVEEGTSGEERVIRTMERGESFGELALVQSSARTATVRAGGEAEAFEIDKGTFDRLLAQTIDLPEFAPTIQAAAELRELPVFTHLESDRVAELLEHGSFEVLGANEVVFEQGQPGDAFYAIVNGRVEVFEGDRLVRTLGAGSFFGELALLLDTPRSATVRTSTAVRLFRLDRQGFDRIVAGAFRRGRLAPHVAEVRTQEH